MRSITPKFPKDFEVIGFIYSDSEPRNLGEDMLEVVLPNGILVDVGWYPEGDPQGRYRVSVTYGLELLGKPYLTTDPDDAAAAAEGLALRHCGQQHCLSDAEDAFTESNVGQPIAPRFSRHLEPLAAVC